jgi:PTH2 family peptidyl-tRNA hydrolase
MENYKQAIVVRGDLKLPKGKMAGQVAHASVDATLKSSRSHIDAWRAQGMKKVVLKVDSLDELYKLKEEARELGLTTSVISDAGKTVVEPGTVTCMAIGPDSEDKIDKITSKLKLI